jgi:hypothetical protein
MKQLVIFLILVILWGVLLIRNSKAEAPLLEISVPLELQSNPIKKFAYNQVRLRWDESHWESFDLLIQAESSWRPTAQNPKSTAFGLGQFLNSTWGIVGYTKSEDPEIQIMATIEYVSKRYGDPKDAWKFHLKNRWY